jgi:AcrR family transcriptional regulator
VDAIDIRLADLTGRARIRHAALHLFGAEGYAQTSLRSIAHTAGVSLALIAHHFGSKHQLRDAVDVWVLATFERAAREAANGADGGSGEVLWRRFADAVGDILGARPEVRAYLRRMVVVDGTPNGVALLGSLLALVRSVVVRSHEACGEPELTRQSLQWLLLLLGPALLEPALHRCIPGLYGGADGRDRSAVDAPAATNERYAQAPARVASIGGGARGTAVSLHAERFRH